MNWKFWRKPVVWQDYSLAEEVKESVRIGQTLGVKDGSIAYEDLKTPKGAKRSNGVGIFESDLESNPDPLNEWLDPNSEIHKFDDEIQSISAFRSSEDILVRIANQDTESEPRIRAEDFYQAVAKRILALEKIERRRELNEYSPVTADIKANGFRPDGVEALRNTVVIADTEFGDPVSGRPSESLDKEIEAIRLMGGFND